MSVTAVLALLAALGGLGGLVNCAISGEFTLPHVDRNAKIWRPGWIGNVLVGAVAAIVVWGIYGPFASFDIVSGNLNDIHFTISQLLSSIVVGLGGGQILTQMAQKQAERVAKETLAASLSKNLEG